MNNNAPNGLLAAIFADDAVITPQLQARGIIGHALPKIGLGGESRAVVGLCLPSSLDMNLERDVFVKEVEYCITELTRFVEPLTGAGTAPVSDLLVTDCRLDHTHTHTHTHTERDRSCCRR